MGMPCCLEQFGCKAGPNYNGHLMRSLRWENLLNTVQICSFALRGPKMTGFCSTDHRSVFLKKPLTLEVNSIEPPIFCNHLNVLGQYIFSLLQKRLEKTRQTLENESLSLGVFLERRLFQ